MESKYNHDGMFIIAIKSTVNVYGQLARLVSQYWWSVLLASGNISSEFQHGTVTLRNNGRAAWY